MRVVLVAALLVLALPGLAKEKEQDAAKLAPTHGFVYAGFSKGGAAALTVEPLQGGKKQVIEALISAEVQPNAQAIGKWLPAGQYKLTGWNRGKWTDGASFEVQAGRITTLGNFVPVNLGGYELVLLPINHPENNVGLAAVTEALASVLKDPAPLHASPVQVPPPVPQPLPAGMPGLIPALIQAHVYKVNKPATLDELKAERDPTRFLGKFRTVVPPLLDEAGIAPDGTLYLGADMGQVRKRSIDGTWTNFGMDTLRQILSVEVAYARVLTGSDDGHVRATSDEGATWTELRTFGTMESVIDIDHADGHWVITTTEKQIDPNRKRKFWTFTPPHLHPAFLRVYVGQRDDLSDLALSKQVLLSPEDQAFFVGAHGTIVQGAFYITIAPRLHRLDLASGQWQDISPAFDVGSHRVDPDSGIVTAMRSAGLGSKVAISHDRGQSWIQTGRPPYTIFDVQMDTPTQGWSVRYNMDAFSGMFEIYGFNPERNDWDKVSTAPFQCKPLRFAKQVPVMCVGSDARLWAQQDGKWIVEFDTHATKH